MRSRTELALAVLEDARRVIVDSLRTVTPDEALRTAGGYRSILGILKHTAAWAHIYHSYAFDAQPRHWRQIDWPRGLPPDVVDDSPGYFEDVKGWLERWAEQWTASLGAVADEGLDEPQPAHWGGAAALFDIVAMVASHWAYHAGEMNAILAIEHGEAWEYTEEVEENHISTAGHRVRPGWMSDEQVRRFEAYRTGRDAELHPGSGS
jgi:hypothetical protein